MNNKKIIFAISLCATLILTGMTVFAESTTKHVDITYGSVRVYINGQRLYKDTIIYEGSTYIPIRAIADSLGKAVTYDDKSKTAYITTLKNATMPPTQQVQAETPVKQVSVDAVFGGVKLVVDGNKVDKETILIEGTTYGALRAVAEVLGMDVTYDGVSRVAQIFDAKVVAQNPTGSQNPSIAPKPTPPQTVTYYIDYNSVADLGSFSQISNDKFTKTTENNITSYRYPDSTLTVEVLKNYTDQLAKDGFKYVSAESNPQYSVYSKADTTVIIDLNYKGYVYVRLRKAITPVMYKEFPTIPDIGSFTIPAVAFDRTTKSADNTATIYWYQKISDNTIRLYVEALADGGYVQDTARSQPANGLLYYVKGDSTIIVDSATFKQNGTVMVSINKIASIVYPREFPSVPIFAHEPAKTVLKLPEDKGYTYLFANVTELMINNYVMELSKRGYFFDASVSKTGYLVYTANGISVTVDSVNFKATNNIGIEIKRISDFNYPKEFPLIPIFGPDQPKQTTPTQDVSGMNYWFQNVTDVMIAKYTGELTRLGFVADTAKTKAGYQVFTKETFTVTVDSNTYRTTGYVIITINQIEKFVYYAEYPNVPIFAPKADVTAPSDDKVGTSYGYKDVKETDISAYTQKLVKLAFVVDTANSKTGVFAYTKTDGTITTSVVIDTVAKKAEGLTVVAVKKISK